MNRWVEVSLSFMAYDKQTNDNYSLYDSTVEKKKKKRKRAAKSLSGEFQNQIDFKWDNEWSITANKFHDHLQSTHWH